MPWSKDPASRRRSNATYNAEYRRNRPLALERARYRCEIRIEGTCTYHATQADHIVPVIQGGTHALSNLRAACEPCHRKVTAQQGGGYRRNARPQDPQPKQSTIWQRTL